MSSSIWMIHSQYGYSQRWINDVLRRCTLCKHLRLGLVNPVPETSLQVTKSLSTSTFSQTYIHTHIYHIYSVLDFTTKPTYLSLVGCCHKEVHPKCLEHLNYFNKISVYFYLHFSKFKSHHLSSANMALPPYMWIPDCKVLSSDWMI